MSAHDARPRLPRGPRSLTRRECEVLALVVRGCEYREIAAELVISRYTVQNHMRHIERKLGARNRTHAAALTARGGVLA